MNDYPKFPTIREEVKKYGLISEYQLRQMLARKELPGFYSGRTFRVNHALLIEKLEKMSKDQVVNLD